MDVVLINVPTPGNKSFGRTSMPLGIAYLAAYVRARGRTVQVIEANGEGLELDAVVARAASARPRVVGLSATTVAFPDVEHICARLKAAVPGVFTIAGGHHPSAVGPAALHESPSLDALCVGEGEETLDEVVDRVLTGAPLRDVRGVVWRDACGDVVTNPRRPLGDLDSLPWPARDLLPPLDCYAGVRRWPTLDRVLSSTITAGRGCPFRCSFCDIHSFYRREDGPLRRVRTPEAVVDEMVHVAERFDAEHFAFVDDLFPYIPRWCESFRDEVRRRGLTCGFSLAARADQIVRRPQLLQTLHAAGCTSIEMGIESGSQSVLDRYQKDLTVAVNLEAIRDVRAAGIRVILDYIMFDPWSTLNELRESLDFLEAAGAEAAYPAVVYGSLTFYPGTPIFEKVVGTGVRPTTTIEVESFDDTRVDAIYRSLIAVRAEHQTTFNAELDGWRRLHRRAVVDGVDDARGEAARSMFAFRRFPHDTLRALVDHVVGGGAARAVEGIRMRAASDLVATSRERRVVVERQLDDRTGALVGTRE